TEDRKRSFTVAAARPGKGFLVARLSGIEDRSAAEELRNLRLYVPRERLPALSDADDFYHADLIDLHVVDAAGHEIGTPPPVPNSAAGDLIEVRAASGGPTVLIPFTKATVPVVDLSSRRLVVDPPDGLAEQGGTAAQHRTREA